jgi:hypothetical protein
LISTHWRKLRFGLPRPHTPIHPSTVRESSAPAPALEKPWRRRLAVPSLLAPPREVRIKEVERGTFSQHAIETVRFDLRIRRAHAVTGQFAREKPRVQDAIDRFVIAYYQRDAERDDGTLPRLISNSLPPLPADVDRSRKSDSVKVRREAFFPPLLAEKIDERWKELRFRSISEYVTSVMRYDLLLGGKHRQFPTNDFHPEILAALDRETLTEFLKNRKPKIFLDYLLEDAAKKELTREECEVLLVAIGKKIRALAIEYFL